MTTTIDVIRYIKSKTTVYGETHAHKLLYYAQAWALAWDGQPDETIEAWEQRKTHCCVKKSGLLPNTGWPPASSPPTGPNDVPRNQQYRLSPRDLRGALIGD